MSYRCALRGMAIVLGLAGASACNDGAAEPAAEPAAAHPEGHEHGEHAHGEHAHAEHEHGEHAHGEHAGSDPHEGHAGHMLPADAPLAGKSLYHLDAALTDHRGNALQLSSLRGSPVLMTMFYASCTSICPMLISQVKRVDDALAPDVRARTRVLLVSLDPARDSVDALAALAKRHAIDDARWHFVRTEPEQVRELAALLGIRYRATLDGEISHSPTIALLDREGVIATRMENAAGDPAPLIAATARAAAVASP